jgi:hypothetical protein
MPARLLPSQQERKSMKNAIVVRVIAAMGTLSGLVAVVGAGTKWGS